MARSEIIRLPGGWELLPSTFDASEFLPLELTTEQIRGYAAARWGPLTVWLPAGNVGYGPQDPGEPG